MPSLIESSKNPTVGDPLPLLDADSDGSVHLPLPAELRQGQVMVSATLTKVAESVPANHAIDHLRKIAARGGLKGIADPMRWQQEIREDRALPGRDE